MQGTLRRGLPLAALLCLAAPAAAHAKQAGDYASTTMVGAMNAAATQDLRSVDVTPVLAQLLSTDAPSARDAKMVELLKRELRPDDDVLVKGSLSMGMSAVVRGIRAGRRAEGPPPGPRPGPAPVPAARTRAPGLRGNASRDRGVAREGKHRPDRPR